MAPSASDDMKMLLSWPWVRYVIHFPTIRALRISCPQVVDFNFDFEVPMYCTLAKNGKEVKASEAAFWESGGQSQIVLPESEVSVEYVRFGLRELGEGEGEGYCGF
jgi:hypothetical protein